MAEKGFVCDCPGCDGVKTADPDWGFDRSKVPRIKCSVCHRRIGRSPYVLDASLARFGNMEFVHRRCDAKGKHEKQAAKILAHRKKTWENPLPEQRQAA